MFSVGQFPEENAKYLRQTLNNKQLKRLCHFSCPVMGEKKVIFQASSGLYSTLIIPVSTPFPGHWSRSYFVQKGEVFKEPPAQRST